MDSSGSAYSSSMCRSITSTAQRPQGRSLSSGYEQSLSPSQRRMAEEDPCSRSSQLPTLNEDDEEVICEILPDPCMQLANADASATSSIGVFSQSSRISPITNAAGSTVGSSFVRRPQNNLQCSYASPSGQGGSLIPSRQAIASRTMSPDSTGSPFVIRRPANIPMFGTPMQQQGFSFVGSSQNQTSFGRCPVSTDDSTSRSTYGTPMQHSFIESSANESSLCSRPPSPVAHSTPMQQGAASPADESSFVIRRPQNIPPAYDTSTCVDESYVPLPTYPRETIPPERIPGNTNLVRPCRCAGARADATYDRSLRDEESPYVIRRPDTAASAMRRIRGPNRAYPSNINETYAGALPVEEDSYVIPRGPAMSTPRYYGQSRIPTSGESPIMDLSYVCQWLPNSDPRRQRPVDVNAPEQPIDNTFECPVATIPRPTQLNRIPTAARSPVNINYVSTPVSSRPQRLIRNCPRPPAGNTNWNVYADSPRLQDLNRTRTIGVAPPDATYIAGAPAEPSYWNPNALAALENVMFRGPDLDTTYGAFPTPKRADLNRTRTLESAPGDATFVCPTPEPVANRTYTPQPGTVADNSYVCPPRPKRQSEDDRTYGMAGRMLDRTYIQQGGAPNRTYSAQPRARADGMYVCPRPVAANRTYGITTSSARPMLDRTYVQQGAAAQPMLDRTYMQQLAAPNRTYTSRPRVTANGTYICPQMTSRQATAADRAYGIAGRMLDRTYVQQGEAPNRSYTAQARARADGIFVCPRPGTADRARPISDRIYIQQAAAQNRTYTAQPRVAADGTYASPTRQQGRQPATSIANRTYAITAAPALDRTYTQQGAAQNRTYTAQSRVAADRTYAYTPRPIRQPAATVADQTYGVVGGLSGSTYVRQGAARNRIDSAQPRVTTDGTFTTRPEARAPTAEICGVPGAAALPPNATYVWQRPSGTQPVGVDVSEQVEGLETTEQAKRRQRREETVKRRIRALVQHRALGVTHSTEDISSYKSTSGESSEGEDSMGWASIINETDTRPWQQQTPQPSFFTESFYEAHKPSPSTRAPSSSFKEWTRNVGPMSTPKSRIPGSPNTSYGSSGRSFRSEMQRSLDETPYPEICSDSLPQLTPPPRSYPDSSSSVYPTPEPFRGGVPRRGAPNLFGSPDGEFSEDLFDITPPDRNALPDSLISRLSESDLEPITDSDVTMPGEIVCPVPRPSFLQRFDRRAEREIELYKNMDGSGISTSLGEKRKKSPIFRHGDDLLRASATAVDVATAMRKEMSCELLDVVDGLIHAETMCQYDAAVQAAEEAAAAATPDRAEEAAAVGAMGVTMERAKTQTPAQSSQAKTNHLINVVCYVGNTFPQQTPTIDLSY